MIDRLMETIHRIHISLRRATNIIPLPLDHQTVSILLSAQCLQTRGQLKCPFVSNGRFMTDIIGQQLHDRSVQYIQSKNREVMIGRQVGHRQVPSCIFNLWFLRNLFNQQSLSVLPRPLSLHCTKVLEVRFRSDLHVQSGAKQTRSE